MCFPPVEFVDPPIISLFEFEQARIVRSGINWTFGCSSCAGLHILEIITEIQTMCDRICTWNPAQRDIWVNEHDTIDRNGIEGSL